MSKTGIIAALLGLAAIVLVLVVAPGMRDSGFIIRAYVITAIILTAYTYLLATRVAQAQKSRGGKKDLVS